MTDLPLPRIGQAIGECRERYDVEAYFNGITDIGLDGELLFRGKHADALAYIDARCAEAAVRAMVPEGPWRVGSHYGIHVYADERPVATFHHASEAAIAVAIVNRHVNAHTMETQP